MPNVDCLIAASQLFDEIGGGTYDTTAVGHITLSMLQDIIERFAAQFEALIVQRLATGQLAMVPVGSELVEIATTPYTANSNMAVGVIPADYVPWLQEVVDQDGAALDHDPDIQQTAETSPFVRHRWSTRGYNLLVTPGATTAVHAFLIDWKDGAGQLAPELVDQFNSKIVAAAKEMLAARIAEQGRIIRSDHDS